MKAAYEDDNSNESKPHAKGPINGIKGPIFGSGYTESALLITDCQCASIVQKDKPYDNKQRYRHKK